MLRSRHAVTTAWRIVPGAEGMAMITSSGFTSSSTRGKLGGGAEHLVPGHPHALLARVVVEEPTAAERSSGLRRSSKATCCPPLPAPTISTSRAARSNIGPRSGRSTRPRHSEARAGDEGEREQEVERDHAARRVGAAEGEEEQGRDQHDRGHHDRLHDRLHVLLVDEAPELRVEAEEREDHDLHRHDEDDRVLEEVLVAVRDPLVEAQDEGEVVGQRDQAHVHPDLPDAPDVDGGADGSHEVRVAEQ